jgi:hypothetical protein
VGGGRVEDHCFGIGDQRDGFPRRVVGQAEENGVCGVEPLFPRGFVFAFVIAEGEQLRAGYLPQPFFYLQAGGPGPSVDKNLHVRPSFNIYTILCINMQYPF